MAISKAVLATLPPAAYVSKRASETKSTSATATATIAASAALNALKTLTTSVVAIPTRVNRVSKTLSTSLLNLPLPPIVSSVTPIASLAFSYVYGKVLSVTQGQSAFVQIVTALRLSSAASSVATLSTQLATQLKTLTASATSTALGLVKSVLFALLANSQAAASSQLGSRITLTTSQSQGATLIRATVIAPIAKALTTASSALASLVVTFRSRHDSVAHHQPELTVSAGTRGTLTQFASNKPSLIERETP
jgi:hypothetical protein